MSTATDKLEEVLATNEDLKGELEKSEEDGKIELPDEKDQPKKEEDGKTKQPKEDAPKDEDKAGDGLTVDDIDSEEEVEEPPAATAKMGKLTPEQQYLVDNIPPLTLSVKVGDKVKEFTVYSPEQLPDDFEYVNAKQREIYSQAFGRMERKAEQLENEYKNLQNVEQGKKYEELENRAIREDIASLQKSGDIAKFKVKTDDPDFNDDPAAKEIQTVVDFMTEKNDAYMKAYNGGGAYRHLGFSEAFALYKAQNPGETNTDKEDKARHEVGKKLGTGQGGSAVEKIIPKRGQTTEQILAKYGA